MSKSSERSTHRAALVQMLLAAQQMQQRAGWEIAELMRQIRAVDGEAFGNQCADTDHSAARARLKFAAQLSRSTDMTTHTETPAENRAADQRNSAGFSGMRGTYDNRMIAVWGM